MDKIYKLIWNKTAMCSQAILKSVCCSQNKLLSILKFIKNPTSAVCFLQILMSALVGSFGALYSSLTLAAPADKNYFHANPGAAIAGNSNTTNADTVGGTGAASGALSLAAGVNASTGSDATKALAVGHNVSATGYRSSALGSDSVASGDNAVALGPNAKSGGTGANAIGANADASGNSSVSIGSNSRSSGIAGIAVGQASKASANTAVALGRQSRASGGSAAALGDNATASAEKSTALGVAANALGTASVAIGANSAAANQGDVALGARSTTSKALGTSSATVNGITYSGFAGTNPVATVSVGSKDGERTITNVAAGDISPASTNAINGSQLYAVANELSGRINKIGNGTKTEVAAGTNIASVESSIGANGQTVYTVNAKGTAVQAGSSNLTVSSRTDSRTNVTTYRVDLAKDLNVNSVTAGNTVMNNNGITIRGGQNGTVSLTNSGLNNGGNTITNVAPGVNGTDAVNVNQLRSSEADINNHINKTDKKLRAGVAGAAAIGMLPQPTLAGKSMVAAAGTNYRGESAMALGVSHISDNNKWVVKLGASADSRSNHIVGASAGYQW